MKRLLLILLIGLAIYGCIPCPALAQSISPAQQSLYLRKSDYAWKIDNTYATTDTITVSAKKYLQPLSCPGGIVSIEGKAIFTAGTDSMKIVVYVSNSQYGYPQDTMQIYALDSFKLLSATSISAGKINAGNFHYRFNLAGEFGTNVSFALVPLNGVTGKLTKMVIGKE